MQSASLLYPLAAEFYNKKWGGKVRLTVAPGDLMTTYLFFKSRDTNILDNLKCILYPVASSNRQNYLQLILLQMQPTGNCTQTP